MTPTPCGFTFTTMQIETGLTGNRFFITPSLAVSRAECSNPDCQEPHGLAFHFAWLCFAVEVFFF